MKKLILSICVVFLLGCSSNDNNEPDCLQLIEDGVAITQELIDTAATFALDPSTANCNTYAAAITNYIDYFQDITSCFENQELDDLIAQIEDLQTDLGNLTCN